ncbi:MAG: hypothetical protein QXE63_06630 [Zestosphaera sp.]
MNAQGSLKSLYLKVSITDTALLMPTIFQQQVLMVALFTILPIGLLISELIKTVTLFKE